jgi:hypothetical protein
MKPPKFLFGHRVDIRAFVGTDSHGEKVYTNIEGIDASMIISSLPTGTVTIKCRFEPSVQASRQPEGQTKRFVATLFTLGTDVPAESVVIYENKKYIVGECIKHNDLKGISYLEVLLT